MQRQLVSCWWQVGRGCGRQHDTGALECGGWACRRRWERRCAGVSGLSIWSGDLNHLGFAAGKGGRGWRMAGLEYPLKVWHRGGPGLPQRKQASSAHDHRGVLHLRPAPHTRFLLLERQRLRLPVQAVGSALSAVAAVSALGHTLVRDACFVLAPVPLDACRAGPRCGALVYNRITAMQAAWLCVTCCVQARRACEVCRVGIWHRQDRACGAFGVAGGTGNSGWGLCRRAEGQGSG